MKIINYLFNPITLMENIYFINYILYFVMLCYLKLIYIIHYFEDSV